MAWYQRNKVLAGAAAGFVAGSVVPGLGNLVGGIAGAFIGPAVISDEKPDVIVVVKEELKDK